MASSADIRIGDLWGKAYKNENLGTNAIIAFTEKGKKLLAKLPNCNITEISASTCIEGQMKKSPSIPLIYRPLLVSLGKDGNLHKSYDRIIKPYRILTIPKRGINKICYKLGIKPLFH